MTSTTVHAVNVPTDFSDTVFIGFVHFDNGSSMTTTCRDSGTDARRDLNRFLAVHAADGILPISSGVFSRTNSVTHDHTDF